MTHAPNCERPGTTRTTGYSVTVTRCTGCGAMTTQRKVTPTMTAPNRTDTMTNHEQEATA